MKNAQTMWHQGDLNVFTCLDYRLDDSLRNRSRSEFVITSWCLDYTVFPLITLAGDVNTHLFSLKVKGEWLFSTHHMITTTGNGSLYLRNHGHIKTSSEKLAPRACSGSTCAKIGTIQRPAWPLCKEDVEIREVVHILFHLTPALRRQRQAAIYASPRPAQSKSYSRTARATQKYRLKQTKKQEGWTDGMEGRTDRKAKVGTDENFSLWYTLSHV